jgi:carboxyl-terminal processing protease
METNHNAEQTITRPVRQKKKSGFGFGMLFGIFFTLVIVFAVYAGMMGYRYVQMREMQQSGSETVVDTNMQMKLQTIEQIIDFYYYKDDVDSEALTEGIYRGMLDAVGDPYTTYYSETELKELMEQTEGVYYGIGAYVALDSVTGLPKIASAIPGTPAEAADLRPDDIIYKVNGQEVYGMDLSAVTSLIKGEEGTSVNLTIIRDGESDYLSVDVVRRKVETPSVESEMFDDGMAYIQIVEFNETTVPQFADALAVAKGSDMKGLIIDLRANPGGSLDAVVNIAQMLLPEGLVVYTEDKYGNREEYKCDGTKEFGYPLVVLIDGNSASASEILAGSIQDYEVGTLVGTTTFGKGIVQQVITLADKSAVKITVSSYYTPKGRDIHGVGIAPDIVCEFDADSYYNEGYDNQLERAKEVLGDLITGH